MSVDDVRLSDLVAMCRRSKEIKAIFEWLDDRERDPRNSETKVANLESDLAGRGERFSVDQLRDALEKIADTGAGTYQAGRPIENSRINWNVSARELAKQVLQELNNHVSNPKAEGTSDGCDIHHFPLRPGKFLPVSIPSDMTFDELENMADFIRVIARSRRNLSNASG
ncbi:MAG: hypothetical protein U0939_22635 [Pirellulales bacterium]